MPETACPHLKSCCYSLMTLPEGSTLIGFIYLIIAFACGPNMLIALDFMDGKFEIDSTGQQIAVMVFVESAALKVLQGLTALILLLGVELKKPSLLRPFIQVMVISIPHAIFVWHLMAFTRLAKDFSQLPPVQDENQKETRLPPEFGFFCDAVLSIYAYLVVRGYRIDLEKEAVSNENGLELGSNPEQVV